MQQIRATAAASSSRPDVRSPVARDAGSAKPPGAQWTVDPFAGLTKDGYVFGRGALDFKGGMAVFARAAMMLAERKVPLDRDVIFLAEADEESGPYSTTWLASQAWQKIDCEFALNEGGWIMKGRDGRVRYVSISTADKSAVPIILTAKGTSTHASMPRPDLLYLCVADGSKAKAAIGFSPRLSIKRTILDFLGIAPEDGATDVARAQA